jgi:uncharacterized protein YdhG (YjbR/CyaY superfamily)
MKPDARVDAYIAGFPPAVQVQLGSVRDAIRRVVPGAEETITYAIPTFILKGRSLVHFAGWQHHISLYPVPDADGSIDHELALYRTGKGTLRFPLGQPMPLGLIERVVALLIRQRHGSRP